MMPHDPHPSNARNDGKGYLSVNATPLPSWQAGLARAPLAITAVLARVAADAACRGLLDWLLASEEQTQWSRETILDLDANPFRVHHFWHAPMDHPDAAPHDWGGIDSWLVDDRHALLIVNRSRHLLAAWANAMAGAGAHPLAADLNGWIRYDAGNPWAAVVPPAGTYQRRRPVCRCP